MKFADLAVGARFRLDGRVYVKLGPVAARDEASGGLRMIPRYLRLEPLGPTPAPEGAAMEPFGVAPDTVIAAFERFHAECLALLGRASPAARARLAAARRRFYEACGLNLR